MAYVIVGALRSVPVWVWCGIASAFFTCAWFYEFRRARTAERALRKSQNTARLWRLLAENTGEAFVGKRTQVAPQYHAPRGA